MKELPDIDQIPPLSSADEQCLRDLKEVLHRHGKLERFGLTLLHQHFPMLEDEMLVETCDPKARVLTIQPIKSFQLKGQRVIETNWRMDTQDALVACSQSCVQTTDRGGNSVHVGTHARTSG